MNKEEFMFNRLINDLEENKRIKQETEKKIQKLRKDRIRNLKLQYFVYSPTLSFQLRDFDKEEISKEIKSSKKLLKSIRKDNKNIRKSINNLKNSL